MLGQESLFNKMTIAIFLRKKMDLVEEIPFFPTASAEESNDSNDGSSYQCPEPGCVEDFRTHADLDLHMSMTVGLYDKVKR